MSGRGGEIGARMFAFATVNRASDTRPRAVEVPWESFARTMANVDVRDAKDGPAWLPATFRGTGRKDANVEAITAAVLDADRGNLTGEQIAAKLNGFAYVAHTTFSSTAGDRRWRVAIPLAEPIPPSKAHALFAHFDHVFDGLLDPACKNPSRLHYLPSCPPDRAGEHLYLARDGEAFDASALPDAAPEETAPDSVAPAAEVPPRFFELLESDEALRQRWEGGTEGLNDTSRSGLDMSLTALLAKRGFADAEIAAILLAFPHGKAREMRADYIPRMLVKAHVRHAERLTDVGNALRFAAAHRDDARYCPDLGKWLVWNGACWRPDEDGAAIRLAKATARAVSAEIENEQDGDRRKAILKWAIASENARRIEAMVALARSEPGMFVRLGGLDADPLLLGCPNGTLDLRTGALREARRDDRITKQAAAAYDAQAACPTWTAFLDRVFAGDRDLAEFAQRALGYSLTGDTSEQVLFMLHGHGANGKTTLVRCVGDLLGEYAQQLPAEALMAKRFDAGGGATPDLARLRGARFVAAAEIEHGQRLAEQLVKKITGGDVIVARHLYAEPIEFCPTHKIWLALNHLPTVRGTDHAMWRRIRLVPFNVQIPEGEQDRHLPDRLRAEWPGILAWLVRGCLDWQRVGLAPPRSVTAATQEYRADMDVLGQWLDEHCVIAADASMARPTSTATSRRGPRPTTSTCRRRRTSASASASAGSRRSTGSTATRDAD